MAKKRDILSNYFNTYKQFTDYYKTRLQQLERDFIDEKNDFASLNKNINKSYTKKENQLYSQYLTVEHIHTQRKQIIINDYKERFTEVLKEIEANQFSTSQQIEAENEIYQDILNQFEERRQEALNKYLQLTQENNRKINESMKVHHDFIAMHNQRIIDLKNDYNDINSSLANELLSTIEKAKNSLNELKVSLDDINTNDLKDLNQTLLKSIEHLRGTQNGVNALFKTTTNNLSELKDNISTMSKTKQKPHSLLNQEIIQVYVKQIREINQAKVQFEEKVKQDLRTSLQVIYPRIIKAADEKNQADLEKHILQKEIIEKKAEYLLHRNKTLADYSISKYQSEIKKIKIDSFKRSEEVKLAYSLPITFLQNSVNIYSNFAFYLNQGFDELDQLLSGLLEYNQNYVNTKSDYIHSVAKNYEEYKVALFGRVSEATQNMSNLITKIDETSYKIITLESQNRLEIAEIKKKMENLEILGDYQKYLASLENDEFFAMYQHNKNIEKIQIESRYKASLLEINYEVLELNFNKEKLLELQEYMLKLNHEEESIHKLSYDRFLSEFEAFYLQQTKLSDTMNQIAKLKIIESVKSTNFKYAYGYHKTDKLESLKNKSASENVIGFIHNIQKLIDTNNSTTATFKEYLSQSNKQYSYLTFIEKNRYLIKKQINEQTNKKTSVCQEAIKIYYQEEKKLKGNINLLISNYQKTFKQLLVFIESEIIDKCNNVLRSDGYVQEVSALLNYIYGLASDYAFKYQVPEQIRLIDDYFEDSLSRYSILSTRIFSKISKIKKSKKYYPYLQEYFIETLAILKVFKEKINSSLDLICNRVMENDILFIAKARINSNKTLNIIDTEYNRISQKAMRLSNKRKRQIYHLSDSSQKLNDVFKRQVKDINDNYLASTKDSENLLSHLKSKLTRIVSKNDKDLLRILKMIQKDSLKERITFDKQYLAYQKTILNLKNNITTVFDNESKYVSKIYNNRMLDLDKTISILESKISELPVIKEQSLQLITTQKNQLVTSKRSQLLVDYQEIEKNKFISRPQMLKDIEKVRNRLPEDYLELYKQIQNLEKDYLNQYTLINEDYLQSYQNYVFKQIKNKALINDFDTIKKPFDKLSDYYNNLLNFSSLNYKETLQKSIETRSIIKEDKQKSKDKQNRIINA